MTSSLEAPDIGSVVPGMLLVSVVGYHLFSPASSSTTNRLLPYCYLHRFSLDNSQVLAALDIGDAFLTVDQQQPTVVTCELASGDVEEFALGPA